MSSGTEPITRLLQQLNDGDRTALEQLMPLVYRELHHMARRFMGRQSPGHTLQTTAVIHEAYLKLAGAGAATNWQNRAHFFSVAATAMRHILVDHARARSSGKRGGEVRVVRLDDGLEVAERRPNELVALDDALNTLAKKHPRKSRTVELRYFGGLSVEETATVLEISPETVMRDWTFAKAFLAREMLRGAETKDSR
jgi:RNA polymerase sigma factor (TIGR02999 family)